MSILHCMKTLGVYGANDLRSGKRIAANLKLCLRINACFVHSAKNDGSEQKKEAKKPNIPLIETGVAPSLG